MAIELEFLYYSPCPFNEKALNLLKETLRQRQIETSIRCIEVNSPEGAAQYQFLGSPTIRINGRDIAPATQQGDIALGCRIYLTAHGPQGYPCKTMIETALEKALSHQTL